MLNKINLEHQGKINYKLNQWTKTMGRVGREIHGQIKGTPHPLINVIY